MWKWYGDVFMRAASHQCSIKENNSSFISRSSIQNFLSANIKSLMIVSWEWLCKATDLLYNVLSAGTWEEGKFNFFLELWVFIISFLFQLYSQSLTMQWHFASTKQFILQQAEQLYIIMTSNIKYCAWTWQI